MHTKTIIFIGPQGSGKGTQAANTLAHLTETSDVSVIDIETGRGFRALASGDNFTAKRVQELLAQGALMPDVLTSSIVMHELEKRLSEDAHIIFDGFPRNLNQAYGLDEMLQFYGRPELTVIYLDVADESVITKRMEGRGREDDTPALITKRLHLYNEQTKPLVVGFENLLGYVFLVDRFGIDNTVIL